MAAGWFAELLLGDADCVGHLAAVFVDHLYEILGYGRGSVQNDREAGEALGDFFEDVKAEGRGNEDALLVAGALSGGELVGAVAGADGDGEGVYAGLGNKLFNLIGTGVGSVFGAYVNRVFDAGQTAEFAFNNYAVVVSVLNNLTGELDVVFEGMMAAVDHNRGETAVDAAFAKLEGIAVIEVYADGKIKAGGFFRVDDGGFDELHKIGMLGILAGAGGNLKNQGSLLFDGGFGDALDDFHVVYVESADGVAAFIGLLEHFLGSYDRHV